MVLSKYKYGASLSAILIKIESKTSIFNEIEVFLCPNFSEINICFRKNSDQLATYFRHPKKGRKKKDDFFQQKILFQEMVQESSFVLDIEGKFLCLDTARFIIGKDLNILLLLMNSKLFFFSIKYFYGGGGLGENGIRMKHTFFNKFHISNTLKDYKDLINEYLNEPIKNTFLIDELIYQNYNLSVEEVEYINSQ